jgi:uncharacterized protein (TIGR00369 family)
VDLTTLKRFFAMSPFMNDLGVEPVAVGEGTVSTVLTIAQRMQQHTGQVHAGVMAAMADHTMGAAAQTQAPEGHWAITAEFKTAQLRPAKGERLVCEAVVIKAGRSLSFTEAEVYAEAAGQRTLVMKASATMALVPHKV